MRDALDFILGGDPRFIPQAAERIAKRAASTRTTQQISDESELGRLRREGFTDAGVQISNCFSPGKTKPGTEDMLHRERVFVRHAAVEFHAYVWHEDGRFHSEVWRHGEPREVLHGDDLASVVTEANTHWGES